MVSKKAPVSTSISPIEAFAAYAKALKGDEKGEAHVFLEHLFQAFGHTSLSAIGATLEHRVKHQGKTSFADLVWPDRALIEMKSRGVRLDRAYKQVFNYWVYLAPHRPRWVVLCNFDEFWIYDFNAQVDQPMEKVGLDDPHRLASALCFLKPVAQVPVFGVNQVSVTREAADLVAQVFNSMVKRGIENERAQRFLLQCVVAKFSEDLDLLPDQVFTRILDESRKTTDRASTAYDLISGLFQQMARVTPASAGRFKGVQYFNGGLYSEVDVIAMTDDELDMLYNSAKEDWSEVNPSIFGTIFQHSMGKEARHAAGAHYTSEADILKVVEPTIVEPWNERIEKANTLKDLLAVRQDMLDFKVLDPACGSGNFLYIAYREMKRLETDLIVKIRPFQKSRKAARVVGRERISTKQFFGFDILPFAVELAKVTMMIGKELAISEARKQLESDGDWIDFDSPLPLENLDENICQKDALLNDWPTVDAIIGNPPFQSKNKAQNELSPKYLNELRGAFPQVHGRADLCVFFIRKTHDCLKKNCRAGLVGTNTIRQNDSREAGLDYVVENGGTITEAVSSQPWSGDAVVHVSIVNWIKGKAVGPKMLSIQNEDKTWSVVEMPIINSALSFTIDVKQAASIKVNADKRFCAQGQTHGHKSFLMTRTEAQSLLAVHPSLREVLFPFLTAKEMLAEKDGLPKRYVIDFLGKDLFESQKHKILFERVQKGVLPQRRAAAEKEKRKNSEALAADPTARVNTHHEKFLAQWWQLSYARGDLMGLLKTLPRYIACPQVAKRPIFAFVNSSIHPNAALMVFPFADDYSYGILQSSMHWTWWKARCSTLKGDPRYTSDTIFDSFMWPQSPTCASISAIASAAVNLRRARHKLMTDHAWSLRDLYRIAEKPGKNAIRDAHEALDAAVNAAYGLKPTDNSLAYLLKLNADCAKLQASEAFIRSPGFPSDKADVEAFITDDSISMPDNV